MFSILRFKAANDCQITETISQLKFSCYRRNFGTLFPIQSFCRFLGVANVNALFITESNEANIILQLFSAAESIV